MIADFMLQLPPILEWNRWERRSERKLETMEEAGVVGGVGMEVDDADPIDVLPDFDKQFFPVDADFFNSFEDDFDDQDLA